MTSKRAVQRRAVPIESCSPSKCRRRSFAATAVRSSLLSEPTLSGPASRRELRTPSHRTRLPRPPRQTTVVWWQESCLGRRRSNRHPYGLSWCAASGESVKSNGRPASSPVTSRRGESRHLTRRPASPSSGLLDSRLYTAWANRLGKWKTNSQRPERPSASMSEPLVMSIRTGFLEASLIVGDTSASASRALTRPLACGSSRLPCETSLTGVSPPWNRATVSSTILPKLRLLKPIRAHPSLRQLLPSTCS